MITFLLIATIIVHLVVYYRRYKHLNGGPTEEYDARKLILKKAPVKEESLVGPEPTKDELYIQIDYLCEAHRKLEWENAALRAEIKILRGL